MSERQGHTKEEWFTERQDDPDDESGEIYWAIHSAVDYEFIANAHNERHGRLMAAAPDLLAALVAMLEAADGVPMGPEKQARAAISKALGKEPV